MKENHSASDELQKKIEEISRENTVTITDLFDQSFMKQYTSVSSFEVFIAQSGFVFESEEEFNKLTETEKWNEYIGETTIFEDWDEMRETAGKVYIQRRIKMMEFN
ncbi:hypothetical protein ACFPU1_13050 [Thalassorhabdus alkalitolerans]|uniref:Uncharacterized protein n=2 Tax=Bacillaceae TaxID=186817 RepID=A0ABW0YQS1_9BACI